MINTISNIQKYAFFDFAYTICPNYFMSAFIFEFCNKNKNPFNDSIYEKTKLIVEQAHRNEVSYNYLVEKCTQYQAEIVRGHSVSEIAEFATELNKNKPIFNYVVPLFNYLAQNEYKVFILTADFDFLIQSILDRLPAIYTLIPSRLEVQNGKFTGKTEFLQNHDIKLRTIERVEATIENVFTIAFGDSQGDLMMLDKADLGFFINKSKDEFENLITHDHIVHIDSPDNKMTAQKIISAIEQFSPRSK